MPINENANNSTVSTLPTEEQLDALQWAKEFMEKYEKRHRKVPAGG